VEEMKNAVANFKKLLWLAHVGGLWTHVANNKK
jgi:hypothetical protein